MWDPSNTNTTLYLYTITVVQTRLSVTGVDPIMIRWSWYRAHYSCSLAKGEVEKWNRGLKSVLNLYDRQETQLAILGTVVWAVYTVQGIRNVLYYDIMWKILETDGSYYGKYWNAIEYCPELDGSERKLAETTTIVQNQAQLTPTLTHVIMCNPVTSGAEDRWCHCLSISIRLYNYNQLITIWLFKLLLPLITILFTDMVHHWDREWWGVFRLTVWPG